MSIYLSTSNGMPLLEFAKLKKCSRESIIKAAKRNELTRIKEGHLTFYPLDKKNVAWRKLDKSEAGKRGGKAGKGRGKNVQLDYVNYRNEKGSYKM